MRNDFDGFIYRCDTEKEIISELEHVSVKTLQTKRQSETMVKRKKNRISEKFGMISKGLVYTELKYQRERERGKEKDIEDAFELLMTKFFFPKLMTPKLKTPNLRVMSFREHLVR